MLVTCLWESQNSTALKSETMLKYCDIGIGTTGFNTRVASSFSAMTFCTQQIKAPSNWTINATFAACMHKINKMSIFLTQQRFFPLTSLTAAKSVLSNWTVNCQFLLISLSSSLRNWTPPRWFWRWSFQPISRLAQKPGLNQIKLQYASLCHLKYNYVDQVKLNK